MERKELRKLGVWVLLIEKMFPKETFGDRN